MPRLPHGQRITFEDLQRAREQVREVSEGAPSAFAAVRPVVTHDFAYLFPELQDDPANLLPQSRETRDALVRLGETMKDTGAGESGDCAIPAAYTYFGQFVDHDVTFETRSADLKALTDEDLSPLQLADVGEKLQNARTPTLNLDSVYGLPAPRSGAKMRIGAVTGLSGTTKPMMRPPGKDDDNDLPRQGRNTEEQNDRAALIGDPRNDENTVVAQLHVAFLRAHNALVDQLQQHGPAGKLPFGQARRRLRQYYQAIILHDFLPRIADEQVIREAIQENLVYRPDDADEEENIYMPLEFSVAAYRFGHSMVRADYDFNLNFNSSGEAGTLPAGLDQLFVFSALSGELGDTDTLPDDWIVEWENLVDSGGPFDQARRIDTALVEPLLALPEQVALGANLAARNLLRGYLLRLPTGQAVARVLQSRLGERRSIPVLSAENLEQAATSDEQVRALRGGGFLDRTPLWYYILAEAATLGGGERLGPVGSTIVAEVLVGLIRRSPHSVLKRQDARPPELPDGAPGPSTLPELLQLAGVHKPKVIGA